MQERAKWEGCGEQLVDPGFRRVVRAAGHGERHVLVSQSAEPSQAGLVGLESRSRLSISGRPCEAAATRP